RAGRCDGERIDAQTGHGRYLVTAALRALNRGDRSDAWIDHARARPRNEQVTYSPGEPRGGAVTRRDDPFDGDRVRIDEVALPFGIGLRRRNRDPELSGGGHHGLLDSSQV